jgi:hypothetical protein
MMNKKNPSPEAMHAAEDVMNHMAPYPAPMAQAMMEKCARLIDDAIAPLREALQAQTLRAEAALTLAQELRERIATLEAAAASAPREPDIEL